MLKKILIVIVILLGIYLVLCIAGPKKMDVTTTQTISGSPTVVYGQLADFRKWPNWSKWIREDSGMTLKYGASSSGVGGSYSWESEKSGAGSMTFTELVPNQTIKSDLVFKDWGSTNKVIMDLKPNGNNTDVTWRMYNDEPTPFFYRGMMLVMNMNGKIKEDFDKGLSNLDELVKSGKAGVVINGYTINESNFPATSYLGKRQVVAMKDISAYFGTHLPVIGKLAGDKVVGPPSGLFWNWDEKAGKADMAAAFPVSMNVSPDPAYQIIALPASKQFTIDYLGNYDKTQMAYAALDSLCKMRGIPHPQNVVEEYLNDPMVEKDTAKWLTRIHYLVK